MLNDEVRNAQYKRAIEAKFKGRAVLDIGMGTGLLSMLAVRAGAEHVYGCEMNPAIAVIAKEIVQKNGEADRVTVVPRASTDIRIGQDIPHQLDGLVTEIMDCGMVGEGLLTSVAHARTHLLKPGAKIVPERIGLNFRLIECADVHNNNFVGEVGDLDLSTFNRYSTKGYFPVRLETWDFRYLSPKTLVLHYELEHGEISPRQALVNVEVTSDGVLHGVAFWFVAELARGIFLSNAPGKKSHWMQAVHCFEHPINVAAGEVIQLRISTDLSNIDVEIVEGS
jgi:type II protein arginine methyltransferase